MGQKEYGSYITEAAEQEPTTDSPDGKKRNGKIKGGGGLEQQTAALCPGNPLPFWIVLQTEKNARG